MIEQTIVPREWIIIDDSSEDSSSEQSSMFASILIKIVKPKSREKEDGASGSQ